MQYSKRVSDSSHAEGENIGSRLLPKLAAFAILVLPALAVASCSDSLTAEKTGTSFATSAKDYENTLTPDQQKALIADLRSEQAKRRKSTQDGTTASIKP